ncbi:MAG: redoxin domain-containing protein [Sulfitobacter sp.]
MSFAPELDVSQWFNTDKDISLKMLRGKVVFIEAFQMLCPGCVVHGIPLAKMVRQIFREDQVAVLGLHTVFEHHDAMTPVSLAAFLHEYQINFPVGVDAKGLGSMPKTMEAYRMRGTPSSLILDKEGQLVHHHFGQVSEMQIGAQISTLLASPVQLDAEPSKQNTHSQCDEVGCSV